jgi:hypothetical protein
MKSKNIDIISVSIPTYMSFFLNVCNKDKFDMFSSGYESMKNYFQTENNDVYSNEESK